MCVAEIYAVEMGCGASAANDIPTLLHELRKRVDVNPSAVTAEDRHAIEQLAQRAGVTPYQIEAPSLVRQSWDRIVHAAGANVIGEKIVHELVRIQPHAEVVFSGVSLARQGDAIRRMIDQVVRIEQENATLVPVMLTLGARHVLYGVEAEHLVDMKTAAMTVFHTICGGSMPPDEVSAWNSVWGTVIELMRHGMKSPVGEANRLKYQANVNRSVQALWQKVLLRQVEGSEDMRLFTRHFYKMIIAEQPDFDRFTNFTDFRTAERVMNMMTVLVDHRVQGRDSTAMLRESGMRHVAYQVTLEDLLSCEGAFLKACKIYMCDDFTIRARHDLSNFWRWMCNGLGVGMTGEIDREAAHAPQNAELAIAFTDVEKSTKLWEANPAVMSVALEKHNRIIRQLLQQFNGYEVKTIGDSFMAVFRNATDAVMFGCAVQTEMMLQTPTAVDFKMVHPTQGGGPADQWDDATMRVRVGIEWCSNVNAQYDAVHRRFDYYGPSVNIASRIESSAAGGQVLGSAALIHQLDVEERARSSPKAAPFEFVSLGTAPHSPTTPTLAAAVSISLFKKAALLKGVQDPVDLYDIAPQSLSRREFHTRSHE
jgi:class 3 adenylate cyclase/hemoglobin-like flavoprotein